MSVAIKALVKAQTEMGAVIKNAANPHLKSKYADLGSVLDACAAALHGNGFAIVQPCGKDDHGHFVETILAHESGEQLASRVYLVIGKNDMQGVGSAITYARRYGLLGMTGLAPEDDDGEATKAKPSPRQETKPQFDAAHDRAVIDAQVMIESAETQADLRAVWGKLARTVQADARVIEAKDKRKTELEGQ